MTKTEAVQLINGTNFGWGDISDPAAQTILTQIVNATEDNPVIVPLVYRANLTTDSVVDPVPVLMGSNTIGNIVWTRAGSGQYIGTLAGAFPLNKTNLWANVPYAATSYALTRLDDDSIGFFTADSTGNTLQDLNGTSIINIEIYP